MGSPDGRSCRLALAATVCAGGTGPCAHASEATSVAALRNADRRHVRGSATTSPDNSNACSAYVERSFSESAFDRKARSEALFTTSTRAESQARFYYAAFSSRIRRFGSLSVEL